MNSHDRSNHKYHIVGCSCLSGDLFGEYYFVEPLSIGSHIIFENVGAYMQVKANMFNGINLPSVYLLENNNFKVLRMGKGTSKEISYKSKNIIDYANSNETSDLLDIFLLKNCKFLISSDTGITIVPEIFDVPILYTNWILIHRLPRYCRNCIVIFKKIYSNNKKRFLNLTEMIELDLGPQNSLDIIKNNNLKIIDNSPNEILDATIELNKRIEGIWKSSNEEDDLQNKFWNIFGKNYYRSQNFFIGTNFLKENSNLFFD